MSSKNKRQSESVVATSELPSIEPVNETEAQLRSVIQDTAVVVSVTASSIEATIVVAMPEEIALLGIPNIETAIGKIGWKLEDWSVEEGKTTLILAADAPNDINASDGKPPVQGWWDGQSFRGDIPEITLDDIKPFLPDHGRLDITVIANAAGCTFLHVDKLLTHAGIPGLRKIDRVWWIGEPQPQAELKAQSTDVSVDSAHLAQVEALKAAIEQLSPEAKAKAAEMGLIASARRSVKSTDPVGSKPPRAAKVREQHECACGCGGLTFNAFCMGHDARAKGRLQRAANGKLTQDEMGWKPNANLIAYVRSHPDWDLKFGAWLGDYEAVVQELGGEDEVILDNGDSAVDENNEE